MALRLGADVEVEVAMAQGPRQQGSRPVLSQMVALAEGAWQQASRPALSQKVAMAMAEGSGQGSRPALR